MIGRQVIIRENKSIANVVLSEHKRSVVVHWFIISYLYLIIDMWANSQAVKHLNESMHAYGSHKKIPPEYCFHTKILSTI